MAGRESGDANILEKYSRACKKGRWMRPFRIDAKDFLMNAGV